MNKIYYNRIEIAHIEKRKSHFYIIGSWEFINNVNDSVFIKKFNTVQDAVNYINKYLKTQVYNTYLDIINKY